MKYKIVQDCRKNCFYVKRKNFLGIWVHACFSEFCSTYAPWPFDSQIEAERWIEKRINLSKIKRFETVKVYD